MRRSLGTRLLAGGFHTTSTCSPTHAAPPTGRNHRQAHTGTIAGLASGFPGYPSAWDRETTSIAEVLRQNGHGTAAFGKWHNTADWEASPAGQFDRWAAGPGFEHWHGAGTMTVAGMNR